MNIQLVKASTDVDVDPRTNALIVQHYDTLKSIARTKRRRANAGQTLLTTDLLHESWMKIRRKGDWQDEAHFMRTAALAMRHVLIDYARSKLAQKRGENAQHCSYDEIADCLPEFKETPEQIILIADLLKRLADVNPRFVNVVDMRYFGGYTEAETASALGITARTIRRDWKIAKAWLAAEMA